MEINGLIKLLKKQFPNDNNLKEKLINILAFRTQ